jgi:hypothetical protein
MRKFHLCMMLAWATLALPTVLWWRDSILWVAFMSLYANFIGHWSAYQGARAEKSNGDSASASPDKACRQPNHL